jgi:hypothetical protein
MSPNPSITDRLERAVALLRSALEELPDYCTEPCLACKVQRFLFDETTLRGGFLAAVQAQPFHPKMAAPARWGRPRVQSCTCAGEYKVITCTRCKGTRLLRLEDAPPAPAKPRKKKRLGKGLARARKMAAKCRLDPMVEAAVFGNPRRRRRYETPTVTEVVRGGDMPSLLCLDRLGADVVCCLQFGHGGRHQNADVSHVWGTRRTSEGLPSR